MRCRFLIRCGQCHLRSAYFERRARQILHDGVVQLGREARSLDRLELGVGRLDLLPREFPASPFYKDA